MARSTENLNAPLVSWDCFEQPSLSLNECEQVNAGVPGGKKSQNEAKKVRLGQKDWRKGRD